MIYIVEYPKDAAGRVVTLEENIRWQYARNARALTHGAVFSADGYRAYTNNGYACTLYELDEDSNWHNIGDTDSDDARCIRWLQGSEIDTW